MFSWEAHFLSNPCPLPSPPVHWYQGPSQPIESPSQLSPLSSQCLSSHSGAKCWLITATRPRTLNRAKWWELTMSKSAVRSGSRNMDLGKPAPRNSRTAADISRESHVRKKWMFSNHMLYRIFVQNCVIWTSTNLLSNAYIWRSIYLDSPTIVGRNSVFLSNWTAHIYVHSPFLWYGAVHLDGSKII